MSNSCSVSCLLDDNTGGREGHMGKLKLGSSFSSSSGFKSICVIYSLCILSNLTNVVEGFDFDFLLQQLLPRFGDFSNIFGSRKLVLNVIDYGASGDGLMDDTEVFKEVWKMACTAPTSRSEIVFPAGHTYLVRPINISGHCYPKVTLRISGTIVAPNDPDDWEGLDPHKWIYFHDVEHLTIEGGGTVNGMGEEWWARSCKRNTTNPCKHAPTALTFHKGQNLKVRNLRILNSQQMHLAFTNCTKVVASQLSVVAPGDSPNTDGIHISASTHVRVEDSIIGTGDDCISIVSNSSGIRIKNIACGPGHGISIGSLGKGDTWTQVHDVRVEGVVLSNTENGVRIKTWQGGSGFASRITFQDVWMENVSNPIIVDQYYCDSPEPCQNKSSAVIVDDISFISIKGTSATEEAIRLACSDVFPCEKLYLEDIQLVSESGGITTAFCWEANGTSSGPVYPPPCFSCNGSFIQQIIPASLVVQSI